MTQEPPQGAAEEEQPGPGRTWSAAPLPGGYDPASGYGPASGYSPASGYGQYQAGGYPPLAAPAAPPGYGPAGYGPPGYAAPGHAAPAGYPPPGGYGPAGAAGWQQPPAAARPGVIPLRPVGVGEILDGGFASIRRNPKAALGLTVIFLLVSGLITTGLAGYLARVSGPAPVPAPGTPIPPGEFTGILSSDIRYATPVSTFSFLVGYAVQLLLAGILAPVFARSALGQPAGGVRAAWRLSRGCRWRLTGNVLLVMAITLAPLLALGLLIFLLAISQVPGPVIALAGFAGVLGAGFLAVWLWTMLSLAPAVVTLERAGPVAALSRSWQLVRRSAWRVFGIQLLTWLIVIVAGFVLRLPFTVADTALVLGGGLSTLGAVPLPALAVSAVGSLASGTVTRPLAAAVTTLLYVDLRMRREGLDLVMRSADSGELPGDGFAALWRPSLPGAPPAAGLPPAW